MYSTITQLHETELISQLHQLTQAKLKSLCSYLHFMRENLKAGNPGEVLMMKNTTVRQVKELTTTFQPDMLEPITRSQHDLFSISKPQL